jgi:hypothetical protein
VREAIRKPYIVYGVVMSNQIYADEIPQLRENGYLEGGPWTSAYIAEHFPQAVDAQGTIDEAALLALDPKERVEVGEENYHFGAELLKVDEFSNGDGVAEVDLATRLVATVDLYLSSRQ